MSICNCQRSGSVLLLSFYLSSSSQIHFRQICEMSPRLRCCSSPLGNRLQNTLEGRLIYSSLQTHFKKLSHLPFPLAVTAAIRIFTVDCLFMFLPSSDSQDAVKILIVLMAKASWNSVPRRLLTTGCLRSFPKWQFVDIIFSVTSQFSSGVMDHEDGHNKLSSSSNNSQLSRTENTQLGIVFDMS